MTAMAPDATRRQAFAARFSELDSWSVGSFCSTEWGWPATQIRPLRTGLSRRLESVDRSQFPLATLQLVTLHFDGTIAPRGPRESIAFKGRLFFAYPGDIVFSKIDVRNGAIGVIPPTFPRVAVSTEYPVYKVHPDIALPSYIQLLFRTARFRRTINAMISGASGRKRVQPAQLEQLSVPLPPIVLQERIVQKWLDCRERVRESQKRVEILRSAASSEFFERLGLPQRAAQLPSKCNVVQWQNVDRWSVSHGDAAKSARELESGLFPVVDLGSVIEHLQYGTSTKANTSGDGIPVLRMNNIKDGLLETADIKWVRLTPDDLARWLLRDGDVLFNRTNSKELVGKCAVFHEHGSYVFASYLIRLRTSARVLSPDFLSLVLNSSIGRMQIDALSRQIIGQANINGEEIRSLRVPLPPLEVQEAIVRDFRDGRATIADECRTAVQLKAFTDAAIEEMILGRHAVADGSLGGGTEA